MIDITLHQAHTKFSRESIEFEDDRYLIRTNGVFLGIDTTKEGLLASSIIAGYTSKGELFVNDMRGSFQIYILDKSEDKHLIYTNHVGDKRIYYAFDHNKGFISSSVRHITDALKKEKIGYSLDRDAVYYMLTYGFMFGDSTLIDKVKRLKPGYYIRIINSLPEIVRYFRLNNTPDDQLTEQDAIQRVDELFRNAVQLEFNKDLEYGLAHLCTLSGGLDSRMTTWVAHELGYEYITNLTFSQSGYLDMTIPQQIVEDLGHRWIFTPLDSGMFMCEVDDVTQCIEGSSSYLQISHGKFAIDNIDYNKFGILHTGQLGDVTVGSYLTTNHYRAPSFTKANSSRFLQKLPPEVLDGFENQELFLYLNRGLNFILSGNIPAQNYTESCSPFLDVDFLNFCMSIPLKYRINHRLYKKWITQKYPDAANYIWERLGTKITARTVMFRKKSISYVKLPAFVIQGIKLHLGMQGKDHIKNKDYMNPFQYWYDTKKEISLHIDNYFKTYIDLIPDASMKADCESLFLNGTISEKAQVLTLLAFVKLFMD